MADYEEKQLALLEDINIRIDKLDSILDKMENTDKRHEYDDQRHKAIKEIKKIIHKEEKVKTICIHRDFKPLDTVQSAINEID